MHYETLHHAVEDLSEPADFVRHADDRLFDGLHGAGTEVKALLISCPVLNDLLPGGALPTVPGPYLWQGTLVEETDPESAEVQTRYWVGTVLPLKETDVTTIFAKFGDRAIAADLDCGLPSHP